MSYKLYTLTLLDSSGAETSDKLTFNDAPPSVEGMYSAPRQSFKLQQMEVGSVPLDYGPDPGNQTVTMTIPAVPEALMEYWLFWAARPIVVNAVYHLQDHRGKKLSVKLKDIRPEFIRTLAPEDVEFWYEYYQAMMIGLDKPLESDNPATKDYYHSDIADLYKVVFEFAVVADPLFPAVEA